MTIAERLDRESPATCHICGTAMPRFDDGKVKPFAVWRVCPNPQCRHDNIGLEAGLIRNYRPNA